MSKSAWQFDLKEDAQHSTGTQNTWRQNYIPTLMDKPKHVKKIFEFGRMNTKSPYFLAQSEIRLCCTTWKSHSTAILWMSTVGLNQQELLLTEM